MTAAPVETATPVETDSPVETATPVETDSPVETATPVETDSPVERATPEAVLRFLAPPPGLAPLTEFTLTGVSGELYALRAQGADGVRLFLVNPAPFFPDYAPRVPADVLAALGTEEPAVLVVVRPGTAGEEHTANLLAPILLNLATGAAVQTILEGSDRPLRAPLRAAAA